MRLKQFERAHMNVLSNICLPDYMSYHLNFQNLTFRRNNYRRKNTNMMKRNSMYVYMQINFFSKSCFINHSLYHFMHMPHMYLSVRN